MIWFTKEDWTHIRQARGRQPSTRLVHASVSNGRRADGWPAAVPGSRNDPGCSPALHCSSTAFCAKE
ncbi:MAG: hypothetical protein CMJ25_18065 [Phycisphaerae bacterium]|nr:hypothetical protein [Phycisphaerae bacterium]